MSAIEVLDGIDTILGTVQRDGVVTINDLLRVGEMLAGETVTVSSLTSEAGPEAEPVAIAEDAAGGLIAIVLFGVIMLLFIGVCVLYIARGVIRKAPIVGSHLTGPIDYLVSHSIRLITDVVFTFVKQIEHGMGFARSIFHLWLHLSDVPTRSEVTKAARAENQHFTKWLNHVQADVAGINASLYHGHGSIESRLQYDGKTLTYLNHEMVRVWHELGSVHVPTVTGLRHDVTRLQREVHTLTHTVNQIQRELHKPLPHSPITLTRIEHDESRITEVETTLQRLKHTVEHLHLPAPHGHGLTGAELHRLNWTHSIAVELAPLVALAPLTASRIGNLRKLEDNPCQCPQTRLPRLPKLGDIGLDGIVADLVIKDGI